MCLVKTLTDQIGRCFFTDKFTLNMYKSDVNIKHTNKSHLYWGIDKSSGDVVYTYAANYALTDISFCFSPNGNLLNFVMCSPVDIEKVLNENVAVIEMQELVKKAENTLPYSDFQA